MAEDWTAIAAEVEEALQSVGQTEGGYKATLRKTVVAGGDPWDPDSGATTDTDTTVTVLEGYREIRDASGTLIGQTMRTLTIGTGAGVVPAKGDRIAPGVAAGEVAADTEFEEIDSVRPLSPAGVAVLYDCDLVL